MEESNKFSRKHVIFAKMLFHMIKARSARLFWFWSVVLLVHCLIHGFGIASTELFKDWSCIFIVSHLSYIYGLRLRLEDIFSKSMEVTKMEVINNDEDKR